MRLFRNILCSFLICLIVCDISSAASTKNKNSTLIIKSNKTKAKVTNHNGNSALGEIIIGFCMSRPCYFGYFCN